MANSGKRSDLHYCGYDACARRTCTYQNGLPSRKPGKPLDSYLFFYWGGWVRTTNLLVNSQALCRLSYAPFFALSQLTATETGL